MSPCLRGAAPYFVIYVLSFVVYAAVAWPHTHPPYIDSYYYVDIARNIAHGRGLTENFVWNYLGGSPSLPHPSSEYWLPAMSIVLAPAFIFGLGYHGVALLTAALASLCPVMAARLGRDLFGARRQAWAMAGLTLFNGIWFHDWVTPDAFVLYAVLATAAFLLAYTGLQGRGPGHGTLAYAAAGLVAGLAALTRQEGVFLFAALLIAAVITRDTRARLWPGGVVAAVALFGVVEGAWALHNLAVLGTPTAAGGNKTLWMRSYDSFFALHVAGLTWRSYAQWGLAHILGARLDALGFTLSTWVYLWLIVLAPPLIVGAWRLRSRVELRAFFIYWACLAVALPLVFTVTLRNGTLGHASSALVPCGSALVVGGIDALARWLTRRRPRHARRLAGQMTGVALVLAAVVSIYMAWRTFPAHGDEYTRDARVVAWLHGHNAAGAPVMVVDPPAFAYLDDRPYVVTPSDGVAAALDVARRYGVRYWALDPAGASSHDTLYRAALRVAGVRRVALVDGVRIVRVPIGTSTRKG